MANKVSNFAKLSHIMAPFKPFLRPEVSFVWTPELEAAFQESKWLIIEAIREGVKMLDPARRKFLRKDWCKKGIDYILSQNHCQCTHSSLPCCPNGWEITLAGSRFLTFSQQGWAPVEGEALAVVWGLWQTRFFTLQYQLTNYLRY